MTGMIQSKSDDQKTSIDVHLGLEKMDLRSKKQISLPLQFHFI